MREARHWVIFGFLLCPAELNKDETRFLLKRVLSNGFVVPLFREKVCFVCCAMYADFPFVLVF